MNSFCKGKKSTSEVVQTYCNKYLIVSLFVFSTNNFEMIEIILGSLINIILSTIFFNIEKKGTLTDITKKRREKMMYRVSVCKSTLNIETNIETFKKLTLTSTLTLSRFSIF